MQRALKVTVGPSAAGKRIDSFLGGLTEVGSRSQAQKLLTSGKVTVDGELARKSHTVMPGQEIAVLLEEEERARLEASDEVDIRYEDDYLLVVNKPAGLVVHPAASHTGITLVDLLKPKSQAGAGISIGLVHRLDKDTSGLLVVAKETDTYRKLQRMIRKREVEREYLVLVVGRVGSMSGTIDAPLGRDRARPTVVSIDTKKAREARTHFTVERYLPSSTLVRARLETGRTHQIRAHFAAIGHPVAGDPSYGKRSLFGLKRQFLHSCRLSFVHPVSAERVEVESDLPDDLRSALDTAAGG